MKNTDKQIAENNEKMNKEKETFSSFRQASIKLGKLRNNSIENEKDNILHTQTNHSNMPPPKTKTGLKKKIRLTPLDPRMYRITFEEYKQKKLQDEMIQQQNRTASAHNKAIIERKRMNTNIKKITTKMDPKEIQFNQQFDNEEHIVSNLDNPNQSQEEQKGRKKQKDTSDGTDINTIQEESSDIIDIEKNKAIIEQVLLEQKDQCYYCLKECQNPIALPCTHMICSSCIEENAKIELFIKPLLFQDQVSSFKCPKCSDNYSLSYPSLHLPLIPSQFNQQGVNNAKCDLCQIDFVTFDCLNCDISICSQCKIVHLANPETQHHKIILYEKADKTSQDITKCSIHQVTFVYFCLNENVLICPKCAELLHKEHYYKKLSEVDSYFHEELKKETTQSRIIVERISRELLSLNEIAKTLSSESEYFLKEANKYFEDILNLVYSHQAIMQNRIQEWFKTKSNELTTVIDKLTLINERYISLINHKPFSNLDKMQQIRNMRILNEQIAHYNFEILKQYANYSYQKYSVFRKIPIKSISNSINKFSFLPLDLIALEKLTKCFRNSNIITKDLITSDLLIALPKIIEGSILYQISAVGPSVEEFHNRCDMKGPTLMIIKTDTGHIFGGFNPFDWKNEFRYEETSSSYLFSISDGKIRKPFRCKVKKVMKEYAIKQNEKEYSPSFGMVDTSDLFISFKQLNNSYSRLGNVYKCPKGYNGKIFLAGKMTDWNILDIEVYSIKYLNDNEYYDMN